MHIPESGRSSPSPLLFAIDDLPEEDASISSLAQLNAHLARWAEAAPEGSEQRQARTTASLVIREAWGAPWGQDSLSLANLDLVDLPDVIWQMPHLRHLDLSGNQLTQLPEQAAQLPALKTLNLARNPISSLGNDWTAPARLTLLNLDGNRLSAFPWTFINLARNGCAIRFRDHQLSEGALARATVRLISIGAWREEIFRPGADILREIFQGTNRLTPAALPTEDKDTHEAAIHASVLGRPIPQRP